MPNWWKIKLVSFIKTYEKNSYFYQNASFEFVPFAPLPFACAGYIYVVLAHPVQTDSTKNMIKLFT